MPCLFGYIAAALCDKRCGARGARGRADRHRNKTRFKKRKRQSR